MLVPGIIRFMSVDKKFAAGKTYHSKWKSFETRSLKSTKPESTNFSATFLTATFDCAMIQTVFDSCSAALL